MLTVPIKNRQAEILTALGGIQQAIDLALQRYIIEQVTIKIAELYQKEVMYQTKYGMDYLTFTKRITEDEELINQIEAKVDKMWEIDLADWEFCYQGREDWIQKLQTILLT
jgi:hypothetical protein